jgi:hypothetical protein
MGPASWLDLIFAAPQAGAGIPLHIISISWGIVNFFMRCAEWCGPIKIILRRGRLSDIIELRYSIKMSPTFPRAVYEKEDTYVETLS